MNQHIETMRAEARKSKPQQIAVAIAMESFGYSLARDLSTVGIWTAGAAINKLTLDSSLAAFLMALCALIVLAARAHDTLAKRVVRGVTVDEVCDNLRLRLETEKFK